MIKKEHRDKLNEGLARMSEDVRWERNKKLSVAISEIQKKRWADPVIRQMYCDAKKKKKDPEDD